MRNPISAAYQLFDDTLMYGANSGVRAYNWTFGGTKDELANGLLTGGAVLLSAGSIVMRSILSPVLVPFSLYFAHFFQKENSRCTEMERRALERRALDARAEIYKNTAIVSQINNLQ